jgi:ADP-ribose pyrophosphatase
MSVVFKGKWFTVEQDRVQMPGGKEYVAEWVTRTDGVRVLARRGNEILITDEYREELGRRDYRLPGGKVENGDSPLGAAMAELREETGFRAADWTGLGSTQAFAMVRYRLHYFEARRLEFDPVEHDEGEDIHCNWFTVEEAVQMALQGMIGEDLSALQLLRLAAREPRS